MKIKLIFRNKNFKLSLNLLLEILNKFSKMIQNNFKIKIVKNSLKKEMKNKFKSQFIVIAKFLMGNSFRSRSKKQINNQ